MNNFGVKQSLSKQDKAFLNRVKKEDLIKEAVSLNLMVDEKLTKPQLLTLIKKQKILLQPPIKKTSINMSDLLESLPADVPKPSSRMNDPYRVSQDPIEYPIGHGYRFPPGSKVIRKEEGFTKTQKTAIRKEISSEIDRLADLLEQFR